MILGFDASTTCCGWAFSDENVVIDAGFIDISGINSNKEKVFHIISIIEQNPNLSTLKKINLEAALSGFQSGRTSQQTIVLLARFNAILEYIVAERWQVPVDLISVMTARKSVFGKCRVKGMSGKDYVRQELPKFHPEISKFEKLNTKKAWDKRNSDMYDAAVISLSK